MKQYQQCRQPEQLFCSKYYHPFPVGVQGRLFTEGLGLVAASVDGGAVGDCACNLRKTKRTPWPERSLVALSG